MDRSPRAFALCCLHEAVDALDQSVGDLAVEPAQGYAGGERAALMYTLIETAKLNGVNVEAYLADLLARIGDHPAKRIEELMPWNWKPAA